MTGGLDFRSALYLGLEHGSRSLAPWRRLTTGMPAALGGPPGSDVVAARLAGLQGCEAATVGTSTLHLFVDLFLQLGGERGAILVDAGSYPVGRLAALCAATKGVKVTVFGRHDASALHAALRRSRVRPVVLADGYAPGLGPAPVRAYADAVRRRGGLLVVDDTQALGILGRDGGGTLRSQGIGSEDVVLVCSLAKAFGAPVAALAGAASFVGRFQARSFTRVHCSPPSAAALAAAARALDINDRCGDILRHRLWRRLQYFRRGLARIGLRSHGGGFPVQVLRAPEIVDPASLHRRLQRLGITAVLTRDPVSAAQELAFVLTARHTSADIDVVLDGLQCAVSGELRGAIAA